MQVCKVCGTTSVVHRETGLCIHHGGPLPAAATGGVVRLWRWLLARAGWARCLLCGAPLGAAVKYCSVACEFADTGADDGGAM